MMHSVEDEPFASLWRYWNKVRGDRLLPGSRELDFTQLAAVLPEMSVIDIISPGEMRYRMAGSDLVLRFGGELTGVNLLDIFSEKSRLAVSQFLMEIAMRPCAGLCQTSVDYQSGREVRAQLLGVPVKPSSDLRGRVVLVQRIEQIQGARHDDLVSISGANFFSTRSLEIGNGKSDHLVLDSSTGAA